MKTPSVIGIERFVAVRGRVFVDIRIQLHFGKHKHHFSFFYGYAGFFPEVFWDQKGDIAAKTINIAFIHPILHFGNHGFSEFGVLKVQLRHIGPIPGRYDFSG